MAICWRYFLSSYVFCVIGDHFWRIEDMLCHHHLHYHAVHHPPLLSSTKRYEKRDPFTPPGYHPNHIDAQLLSQSLCYHFQGFESFLEPSLFLAFKKCPRWNKVKKVFFESNKVFTKLVKHHILHFCWCENCWNWRVKTFSSFKSFVHTD